MKQRALKGSRTGQRGGLVLGMIIGLLIGLGVALAVALYIAKVPVPFVDKVPHRTPEQDAAEIERNKHWDPNAPLAGKGASAPLPAFTTSVKPAASAPVEKRVAAKPDAGAASGAAEGGKSARDPAAILAGQSAGPASSAKAANPSTKVGDPYIYFVQAGAYSSADDAEQQRARLAMQGMTARVTEREQSGRTIYRVRMGPFNTKDEADEQQERLKSGGAEAVLVRVERPAR